MDFGSALSAAGLKKQVPVTVVTDTSKVPMVYQEHFITEGRRRGKSSENSPLGVSAAGTFTQFEGTIQVIDRETSAVPLCVQR